MTRYYRYDKEKTIITLAIFTYIFVLNLIYVDFISPLFSYSGFIANSLNSIKILAMVLFGILPSFWLSARIERPSQVVCWLLYIILYIPICIIPYYTLNFLDNNFYLFNAITCIGFSVLNLTSKLPIMKLRKLEIDATSIWFFLGLVAISFNILVVLAFGISFRLPSLLDVYDVRAEYTSELAATGGIGGRLLEYAVSWLGNSINPFLIGFGLVYKRPVYIVLGWIGQIFLFTITGSKSVFFSIILIIVLFAALRKREWSFGVLISASAVLSVVIITLIDWYSDSIILTSLFVRRVLLVPALLTGFYFDFFNFRPKAQLGNSFFSGLFDYPYDLPIPFLIGREYFNSSSMSANANFIADAFANFGFLGVIIFFLILMIILWFIDSLTVDLDIRLTGILLSIPAYSLSNSGLFTSLLTHGILFTIFLIWITQNLAYSGNKNVKNRLTQSKL